MISDLWCLNKGLRKAIQKDKVIIYNTLSGRCIKLDFKSHDIYKEFERLSSFNYEDVKGLEVCQDVPDEELYAFIMFLKERGFINGD